MKKNNQLRLIKSLIIMIYSTFYSFIILCQNSLVLYIKNIGSVYLEEIIIIIIIILKILYLFDPFVRTGPFCTYIILEI